MTTPKWSHLFPLEGSPRSLNDDRYSQLYASKRGDNIFSSIGVKLSPSTCHQEVDKRSWGGLCAQEWRQKQPKSDEEERKPVLKKVARTSLLEAKTHDRAKARRTAANCDGAHQNTWQQEANAQPAWQAVWQTPRRECEQHFWCSIHHYAHDFSRL